jgi:Icc-related predicted phosphoesterase
MKIWHISDTHTKEEYLNPPKDCDIVIFSGDCSNPREPSINEMQVRDFITWFVNLPIKYKIFVAGNHDTSIEAGYLTRDNFESVGITYLENSSIEIEGLKIWGSPYTPSFGIGWAYNKKREKLHDLWATIPDDTDIIISHGPPKGIMDLAYHKIDGKWLLEYCGCGALLKRVFQIKPKLVCFGHIHDNEDNLNSGIRQLATLTTIFSNGSVVTDGEFDKGPSNNGNLITI